MTTDTRTTQQNYPKPYPSNLLAADVVRLRDALDAIDTDMAARPSAAAVTAEIAAAIAALIDASPSQLDTLNELAAALGDDSNFAATVTTALAGKLDLSGGTLTGQITLPNNPTSAMQAATKSYVDSTALANAGASLGLAVALG